jgi:hypothetical protein
VLAAALCRAAAIAAGCSLLTAACKPHQPDLLAERRAEATKRVAEARERLATPTEADEAGASPGAGGDLLAGERPGSVADLAPELAELEVARIGETVLTLGHVADYIAGQPPHVQARYTTLDGRKELLDALVEFEVLAHEAKRRGLDRTLPVQLAWKEALAVELLRRDASGQVTMAGITPEEVRAWYQAHADRFTQPERRRAAILVSDDEATARAVHAELTTALAQTPAAALQVFGDFAAEKSVDPQRKRIKGDMGVFGTDGLNEKGQRLAAASQAAAVFALPKVGAVSPPFQMEDGNWATVQLTHLRPAVERPVSEVDQEIRNMLFREKLAAVRKATIDGLVGRADVKMDASVLARLPERKGPAADVAKEAEAAKAAQDAEDAEAKKKAGDGGHLDPKMLRRGIVPRMGRGAPAEQVPTVVNPQLHLAPEEVLRRAKPQGPSAEEGQSLRDKGR